MYKMAYKPIVHDLFRSIETMLHERFAVIEEVIRSDRKSESSDEIIALSDKLTNVMESLERITMRLSALESSGPIETVHVTRIDTDSINPVQNIFMKTMAGLEINSRNTVEGECESPADSAISDIEDAEEEEEVVEEEVEEEEEVVEEEVEEEEGIELEEFPYKGKVYYKDPNNTLYKMADDGEPIPIGRYDPSTQKVSKL